MLADPASIAWKVACEIHSVTTAHICIFILEGSLQMKVASYLNSQSSSLLAEACCNVPGACFVSSSKLKCKGLT